MVIYEAQFCSKQYLNQISHLVLYWNVGVLNSSSVKMGNPISFSLLKGLAISRKGQTISE